MSADIARDLQATTRPRGVEHSLRMRLVLALGPLTSLAGVAWAVAQPWRITLLHPHHQGFWWLFSEPPLYAVVVGILFWRLVARPLVEDMRESGR